MAAEAHLSAAPIVAALAFLLAALGRGAGLPAAAAIGSRVLAVMGAVALLFHPTWSAPVLALAAAAAALATPVVCLVAATGSLAMALGRAGENGAAPALVLAALALAAAAVSIDGETDGREQSGREDVALATGLFFTTTALFHGGGQLLAWTFSLDPATQVAAASGAGLVLGLALLAVLAGTLALGAHRLTPGMPSPPVRRFGVRALVVGSTLAVLGVGTAIVQGGGPVGSSSGASLSFLLMSAAAGATVLFAFPLTHHDPAPVAGPIAPGTWLHAGVVLAVVAAVAVGYASWLRLGTYATPSTAGAAAAVLAGMAALESTRFALTRQSLFVLALVWLILG